MKKTIFAFVVMGLLFSSASQGQEEGLLPNAGDYSLEVMFFPANNIPIAVNNIRARMFRSETMALRAGFLVDVDSFSDEIETTTGTGSTGNIERNDRVIHLMLAPGVEFHYPMGQRFSPYFGAELQIMNTSARFKETYSFNSDEIVMKGADSRGNRSQFSLGLNGVAGFDLYVFRGLYMGVEMGYGLTRSTRPDIVISQSGQDDDVSEDNTVRFTFGVNAVNAIRLGWNF